MQLLLHCTDSRIDLNCSCNGKFASFHNLRLSVPWRVGKTNEGSNELFYRAKELAKRKYTKDGP